MYDKIKRQCPACAADYYADPSRLKHGRQTTCSRRCSYELRARGLNKSEQFQCGNCGKPVFRPPALKAHARHGVFFCSRNCAYARRVRIVSKPYVLVSECDRSVAMKKAWKTRRINAKPYPDSARKKATARAISRILQGGGVSKFERKAADVFRLLGFPVIGSIAFRRPDGTFACVFDIYLPSCGIMVECHGTFWHGGRWTWDDPGPVQSRNLCYEALKMAFARECGLEVRILWEHEFRKDPCGACLAVVR